MSVFLYVHMCTMCMSDIPRGQKRGSGPLELQLWVVVSHHMSDFAVCCSGLYTTYGFGALGSG